MNYAGVWIDDVKLQDEGIIVLLPSSEPILAAPRNRSVTIPNRHGAHYFGGHLAPKEFALHCMFTRTDYADMKARIGRFKRLLIDGNGRPKTVKLRFEDEPDRYYNVVYDGVIDIERIAELGRFTVPLTAYDPIAVSAVWNSDVLWGATDVIFLSDYAMGHSGDGAKSFTSAGTTLVTVTGDNLKPVIHVTGSGTNVSIGWGGKRLTLGSFTNTAWVIDLDEFTVMKNGALAIDSIGGDWLSMELGRGENVVSVGGTGMSVDVSFKYRDIWNG